MKILAVATDNFEFYYDVVKELKHRDIPFVSLSPQDPIPENVGVVLTSRIEKPMIDHDNVIGVGKDIRMGVRIALNALSGKSSYQRLVVGIDPGFRPGVALMGDGKLLETAYADSPETVKQLVERYMEGYDFHTMIVKVGHGDKTNRNRTLNSLKGLPLRIEIVNEEYTTERVDSPDIQAARKIAMSKGQIAYGPHEVEATEGEKKEMQRRSRLQSNGEITISKELAQKVVEGELKLKEAIKKQRERKD
ncbi:MAG: hypothetical protein R6U17_07490 [Thermoplasmata archaeon]